MSEIPAVTMVVAAYNEEDVLEEKIANCLALNYPQEKITFIFITDGSTDRSAAIINKHPQLVHLHENQRRGKLAAMNRSIDYVKTGYVIFSDANTFLNRDCVQLLLRHYQDPHVGAVAGEKKIMKDSSGVAKGEGLYWKYESLLKSFDSQVKTVVGAAGELFSLRAGLYTRLPENIIIEDFVQSLLICGKGYAVRYEPGAYSMEKASLSEKDEMERKIRITAGGFQAIVYLKHLLNVFRYPVVSFQYLSHRVLRWTLCPIALITLFITSVVLINGPHGELFRWFTILQLVFYVAAGIGWWLAKNDRKTGVFYLPFYFVFMNFCVFAGFGRFISGSQQAVWQKAGRTRKNNI